MDCEIDRRMNERELRRIPSSCAIRHTSALACAAALCWCALAGCKDSPGPTAAAQPSREEQAPPAPAPALAPAPDPVPTTDPCARMCEHTVAMHCGSETECMMACRQMQASLSCQDEMHTVLECMGNQPRTSWECTPQATLALKDGLCDREQQAFALCAQGEQQGGG